MNSVTIEVPTGYRLYRCIKCNRELPCYALTDIDADSCIEDASNAEWKEVPDDES